MIPDFDKELGIDTAVAGEEDLIYDDADYISDLASEGEYKVETRFEATEDQASFIDAGFSGDYSRLIAAGSIRSGKTIGILAQLTMLCKIYPRSKWYVLRHDMPSLKRTTIPTFFNYVLPAGFMKNYNQQDQMIYFHNGSMLGFLEENLAKDPELNRFKGLEANGFFLNQMEELSKKTYYVAITRAGQWKIDPMPPSFIFGDTNPTQKWVKEVFYDPFKKGSLNKNTLFHQFDIFRNPHITKEYLDSLQDLPAEMFARFVKGQWDAVDEVDQLVSWDDIYGCAAPVVPDNSGIYLGVDVGRKGPDPSVWVIIKDGNILPITSYKKTTITQVDEKTEKIMAELSIPASNVVVDSVGLGAGVVDNLHKKGHYVLPMVGGAQKEARERCVGTNFHFANMKAWSYWTAKQVLQRREVGQLTDETLKSEAGAIYYFITKDKHIAVESKEDLKKRIGRSCDFWDALVYAIWAWKRKSLYSSAASLYTGTMLRRELAEEALRREAEAKKNK